MRTYYEPLCQLPKDIKLEVLSAIIEYALYGRLAELKPVAASLFSLIKPNIDASLKRAANGRSGGRKASAAQSATMTIPSLSDTAEPTVSVATTAPVISATPTTYEQEVERMRRDNVFRAAALHQLMINDAQLDNAFTRFLLQVEVQRAAAGRQCHDSYEDCKRHFLYWYNKAASGVSSRRKTRAEREAELMNGARATLSEMASGTLDVDEHINDGIF
ncbi:MAG: DUF6291 domain-containing protein [Muribaculaceae bacterium]